VAALAALGFASYALVTTVQTTPPDTPAIVVASKDDAMPPITTPAENVTPWPAIFGTPQITEPQPPRSTPTDTPPAPPLSSMGYSLKGIVQNTDQQWAILGHPTGDRILKIGDTLDGNLVVDAISEQGIWVNSQRGRELLAFEESQNP
jgi:hypothetical protein